jgi:hypothetical protein
MDPDLENYSPDEIRRLARDRLLQMKVSIVLRCEGYDLQIHRTTGSGLCQSRMKTISVSTLTDLSNMFELRVERRQLT